MPAHPRDSIGPGSRGVGSYNTYGEALMQHPVSQDPQKPESEPVCPHTRCGTGGSRPTALGLTVALALLGLIVAVAQLLADLYGWAL